MTCCMREFSPGLDGLLHELYFHMTSNSNRTRIFPMQLAMVSWRFQRKNQNGRDETDNFLPMSLLNVGYKIFAKMLVGQEVGVCR